MLGPNHHSYHPATQRYEERLTHAARIRMVQRERDGEQPFDRATHRAITVRRLAEGIAHAVRSATQVHAPAVAHATHR